MAWPPDKVIRDSAEWGLSRSASIVLLAGPLVGAVAVAVARINAPLFRLLTKEDGPIEWSQVLLFVATAGFALLTAYRLLRNGRRLAAVAFLGFGLMCVLVAGEEIAWGQRAFDIDTLEALEEINEQGETTVHNITGVLWFFNLGMLAISAYGATAPFVAERLRLPPPFRRLFVPPMALVTAFALPAALRLVRFAVVRNSGYTLTKWGEWTELCLAAAFCVFTGLAWGRARGDNA